MGSRPILWAAGEASLALADMDYVDAQTLISIGLGIILTFISGWTGRARIAVIIAGVGKVQFRNEVIWWYRKWGKPKFHFLSAHDVLLFYAKAPNQTFHVLNVPLAPSTMRRFGGKRQDFADEARTRKIATDEESRAE